MRKNIKWYVLILLVAILFQNVGYIKSCIASITKPPEIVKVYSDDPFIIKRLSKHYVISGKRFEYSNLKNANIVISSNTYNDKDFTLLDNYFYSPIVAFNYNPRNNLNLNYDDGYHFSYSSVVQGFVNEQKYKDIGLDSNEKINIFIPSKESKYYKDVEKAIQLALENSNISYADFYKKLKESNKKTFMDDLLDASSDNYYSIVFAPEFYYQTTSSSPIYDNNLYSIKYNVYTNNDNSEIVNILFSEKFGNKFYLRSSECSLMDKNYTQDIIEYKEYKIDPINTSEIIRDTINTIDKNIPEIKENTNKLDSLIEDNIENTSAESENEIEDTDDSISSIEWIIIIIVGVMLLLVVILGILTIVDNFA